MYTPQLSDFSVISVRRLAWAMGTTMGAALTRMVKLLPADFDRTLVCQRCKDNTKCTLCVFTKDLSETEKVSLVSM
jgi:hypothetical protein